MGIISLLYLVLWAVLLSYFQRSVRAEEMGIQFQNIASVMLTQTGFHFASMLLCLISIMLGAGVIASELDTGMVHAIITRPIRRRDYVLGKFAGLSIFVLFVTSVLFFLMLAIGAVFSLVTITGLSFLQILQSWLLYLLVPLTLLCLTIFGSVSLKTVPCGLSMIAIYILGNIGGMLEMIGRFINNASVSSAGIFLSLVSPFHILYTTAERMMLPSAGIAGDMMRGAGGLAGSGRPASVFMFIYIGCYSLFFVIMAVRKFDKMDIT